MQHRYAGADRVAEELHSCLLGVDQYHVALLPRISQSRARQPTPLKPMLIDTHRAATSQESR